MGGKDEGKMGREDVWTKGDDDVCVQYYDIESKIYEE
jgi:hypothetical protein